MLPVPLNKQHLLLAAYLADEKTRAPLALSLLLGVGGSIASAYAIARLTPERDGTSRLVAAAASGTLLSLFNVLYLANRAEMIRQARGAKSTWLGGR